jgi:hypothetical protein
MSHRKAIRLLTVTVSHPSLILHCPARVSSVGVAKEPVAKMAWTVGSPLGFEPPDWNKAEKSKAALAGR